jgi:carboxymethylenebutenolidase
MPSGLVEINKDKEVKFKGYVTAPASGVYPGVLLLHQEFGIDANIRNMAELCAAKGYTVFVPDLFWRELPGCELNSDKKDDLEQASKLVKNYNIDKGYEDVVSCLQWLRETPQCNGLVTTIGYGIGANLSYLSGLWLDIESSVCYDFEGYGFFQEHDTFIRRPMLIHLCKAIYNNLKDNDKIRYLENINNIKLNVYDNCEKNFTRVSDKKFNEIETLKSQKETFSHILEAFNKPHTHS